MKQLFAKLMVAGLIGLSAVTGLGATAASAETLSFGIRSDGIVDVQYGGYPDRRPDWGHDRRPGWGPDRRGRCEPWLATDKARAYGLRRAQVVHVSPRRVVVEGHRHGNYRSIVFANVRGCPTLGR
ncbi:hypothetical protein QO002_003292 [Pararhizobium capsulatum DSM 1112]|uniref:Uncharacterized protein n=1 Tax=Pararhizobium capsulatum DSM 1112 TaxID=1121113 RepID=A0ABU0BSD0_9HYPH|nr:hypothetical protein [Pararhizobium capsulatum]MDQ0321154.1 hypothetical protein [Pararhizobium capsulatum DSM 1112]